MNFTKLEKIRCFVYTFNVLCSEWTEIENKIKPSCGSK